VKKKAKKNVYHKPPTMTLTLPALETVSVDLLRRCRAALDSAERDSRNSPLLLQMARWGNTVICAEWLRQNPPEVSEYDDDPAMF
jgi:hypothetical protein